MNTRYAVYFAPGKSSAWQQFGAHWLGRDEFDNHSLPQPTLEEISPDQLEQLTQVPRRYGFHATLNAPFHLAPGLALPELKRRMHQLASTLRPVALGQMKTTTLGNFVALVPHMAGEDLQALAAACVTDLNDLRAPLDAHTLSRRQKETLDARATELLTRYGYPHVLDRYRLHFTLTGPVTADEAAHVTRAVAPKILRLNTHEPLVLDRLCLFVEPAPDREFQRIADFTLATTA